jgi:hypothetical protein
MDDAEVDTAINAYGQSLGLPVTDALSRPENDLVEMVLTAFPSLGMRPLAAAE